MGKSIKKYYHITESYPGCFARGTIIQELHILDRYDKVLVVSVAPADSSPYIIVPGVVVAGPAHVSENRSVSGGLEFSVVEPITNNDRRNRLVNILKQNHIAGEANFWD